MHLPPVLLQDETVSFFQLPVFLAVWHTTNFAHSRMPLTSPMVCPYYSSAFHFTALLSWCYTFLSLRPSCPLFHACFTKGLISLAAFRTSAKFWIFMQRLDWLYVISCTIHSAQAMGLSFCILYKTELCVKLCRCHGNCLPAKIYLKNFRQLSSISGQQSVHSHNFWTAICQCKIFSSLFTNTRISILLLKSV